MIGGLLGVLFSSESSFLRDVFIATFVNEESDYFKTQIQQTNKFSDGQCYTGYLWDCMVDRRQISFNFAINFLKDRMSPIYVFWDIHTNDLIFQDNLSVYPKDSVLLMSANDVTNMLAALPEDCYFFDNTLSWAIALTHEETKPGKRLCYLIDRSVGNS